MLRFVFNFFLPYLLITGSSRFLNFFLCTISAITKLDTRDLGNNLGRECYVCPIFVTFVVILLQSTPAWIGRF